jgi:hypothetical protein
VYFCIEVKFENMAKIVELCGNKIIANSMYELLKVEGMGCARFFCGYIK